jgi:hypothetical protein
MIVCVAINKLFIKPNKNQPLLIQFDQTIRTKCHTTRPISYIPCLRWHSTWRDLFINNSVLPINSLNRLICNKHGENIRRVASCCYYLIKLKQQILILVEFVTISILLFSFVIKLIKKKIFVINPNKNQPLLVQFHQTIRTKCHTTRLISYIPCLKQNM